MEKAQKAKEEDASDHTVSVTGLALPVVFTAEPRQQRQWFLGNLTVKAEWKPQELHFNDAAETTTLFPHADQALAACHDTLSTAGRNTRSRTMAPFYLLHSAPNNVLLSDAEPNLQKLITKSGNIVHCLPSCAFVTHKSVKGCRGQARCLNLQYCFK